MRILDTNSWVYIASKFVELANAIMPQETIEMRLTVTTVIFLPTRSKRMEQSMPPTGHKKAFIEAKMNW